MQKRIIVVDDDDDVLQIMRFILEEQGHLVEAVCDIESFNRLTGFKPDLILLDDWLIDGYGHELCQKLKQDHRTRMVPVILISAQNGIEEAAEKGNADDYITKPFDVDFFMSKIQAWLSPHYNSCSPN
ncbi:two-component system, OmpR family, phosphate regulon response regulator PhoB/two-component system, OmpR family, alkaline phosphatase synthesis response regulator PhoP [Mucilaginibacter gossypiicola]|uniref:Two-component system, OmpR family, phosphate regulon response regulator PhoB/two-component system, OmpR family, alkaline phosphatase synthesis response regulator PhoP n=2 Tax=Mucilaginibacter gossypiicola TaxID=551995 RepID=A0A1H8LTU2_9SPHI|nr:two-component system, OmpR family, phosphate regulon response regulator PhoB/two-component system, OmpR family, alkaline phosphatase synthesis response regulator PhoP [Mucilaginibacter gossypiicola]